MGYSKSDIKNHLHNQMHRSRESMYYADIKDFIRLEESSCYDICVPEDFIRSMCDSVPEEVKAQVIYWHRTHSSAFDICCSYGQDVFVQRAVESVKELILEEFDRTLDQVFYHFYKYQMGRHTLEDCALELANIKVPVETYQPNYRFTKNLVDLRTDFIKKRLEIGI
jgi:hypothetical protein